MTVTLTTTPHGGGGEGEGLRAPAGDHVRLSWWGVYVALVT